MGKPGAANRSQAHYHWLKIDRGPAGIRAAQVLINEEAAEKLSGEREREKSLIWRS